MVDSIYEACKSIAVAQQQVYATHLPVKAATELPHKHNLMEETYGRIWAKTPDKYLSSINCTIEYANQNKLQQDHPCVVQLIRKNYLVRPAPKSVPYQLGNPLLLDPSDGQAKGILRILRNQTNGFFIECGAYDGETLSNTLYMERSLAWTGLLIETDQVSFKALIGRNRKAFTSPVCLIGRTKVDYFSLDIEGSESQVLKTIPWNKVDIRTLTVEWNHAPEGEAEITRFMESNKFIRFGQISMAFSKEVVFVKDFSADLRQFEDY
ncbi:uncharacterized protein LOC130688432 [Daphnia carinata]|uniref:uncharacterized protein LOC130688432 n=1 Tax=Daphnia carinata TaxID=120202 RepID=UPI00257D0AED|nr:uncharacterized protein LOC130688432 [Daphnia carinata]